MKIREMKSERPAVVGGDWKGTENAWNETATETAKKTVTANASDVDVWAGELPVVGRWLARRTRVCCE